MTSVSTGHKALLRGPLLVIITALTLFLAACGGGASDQPASSASPNDATSSAAPETIVDSQGNEFEYPTDYESAIVLNSTAYEMIGVLDKTDMVIGVGDAVTGFGAEEKDKFGDWKEPNVEAILAAQPDVVFGYGSWLDSGVAAQLQDAGVPVVMLDLYKPDTFAEEVEFLGKLLGAEDRAAEFLADIEEIQSDVAERTADVEPALAYWEGYTDYKSVGAGSGGHLLMELAGVENIAAEADTAYPEISDEFVLSSNPDIIIKTVSESAGALGESVTDPSAAQAMVDGFAARPGWTDVSAIQQNKVLLLGPDVGTNPLGMAMVPLYVGSVAYPEQFSDVDPDETLETLLSKYWDKDVEGFWVYTPQS